TPAVELQFVARFGAVAVLHSGLSESDRHEAWWRIQRGEAKVVLGTRSAVFAPLDKLGLVVVDEEHESGYKQEETPRYHGRDVAVVRARLAHALAVLGSATPSLESYWNARQGKYRLYTLKERIGGRQLAGVEIVDMRQEFRQTQFQVPISRRLEEEMDAALEARAQTMILLNRRGYFRKVLDDFRQGTIDILVGTQLIAKGHDFPGVTLVGAISADIGLGLPDFRAAERTFQLLTQAAGRAGRGDAPGRVLVQTFFPEHYAIRLAAEQNYEGFFSKEMSFRRLMHYPPSTALANVIAQHP